MSAIESSIVSLLRADADVATLVSTRIYPNYAPHNYTLPCIVYTRLSTDRVRSADGPNGLLEASFQLSCWAATYAGAKTLSQAVRLCLDDYNGMADGVTIDVITLDNELDAPLVEPDNEERTEHGAILEFTIWFRE